MSDGPDRSARDDPFSAHSDVDELALSAVSQVASRRLASGSNLSERLVRMLMESANSHAGIEAKDMIHEFSSAGVRAEDIQDLYIPEVARRFGTAWEEDQLSFVEVSIGTARLQRLLHDLPVHRLDHCDIDQAASSVLIVVPTNEDHTLGAMSLAEQMRRLGVSVSMALCEDNLSLLSTVADGHFDAIFVSISAAGQAQRVGELVDKIRSAGKGHPSIVVGGTACINEADIKSLTHADFTTSDPEEAIRLCNLKTFHHGEKPRETVR